jgi:hypothetical protein
MFDLVNRSIKMIVEESHRFDWELWQTGMLRLDLAPDLTLHIWDMRFRNETVTLAHDHPWHFESTVISGHLLNRKFWCYKTEAARALATRGMAYTKNLLTCGAGACVMSEPEPVLLVEMPSATYPTGARYAQGKSEIHETEAHDGTVTLVKRTFDGNRDQAHVYVPDGHEFGSAEPRKATIEEVAEITSNALAKWQTDPV